MEESAPTQGTVHGRSAVSVRGLAEALLAFASWAVGLCTIAAFLGRWSWWIDLTSHFRVQYLVVSVGVSFIYLFRRRCAAFCATLATALVNLAVIAPIIWFAPERSPTSSADRIRAVLVNVHRANRQFDRVRDFLLLSRPDIAVLEEVDSTWLRELSRLRDLFPHWIEEPRDDDFGIALLSRYPVEQHEIIFLGESDVPSILARLLVRGQRLTVLATHPLPPGGRDYSLLRNQQLAAIGSRLRMETGPRILIGDLNTTPWNHHFQRLLEASGMLDSTRGFGLQPTWPADLPLMRIPLDHFLHSGEMIVIKRSIGPAVGSDHLPLVVEFELRVERSVIPALDELKK